MRSGVARSPNNAVAGPPGNARTQMNNKMLNPNRIGMSNNNRRTTKRIMRQCTFVGTRRGGGSEDPPPQSAILNYPSETVAKLSSDTGLGT